MAVDDAMWSLGAVAEPQHEGLEATGRQLGDSFGIGVCSLEELRLLGVTAAGMLGPGKAGQVQASDEAARGDPGGPSCRGSHHQAPPHPPPRPSEHPRLNVVIAAAAARRRQQDAVRGLADALEERHAPRLADTGGAVDGGVGAGSRQVSGHQLENVRMQAAPARAGPERLPAALRVRRSCCCRSVIVVIVIILEEERLALHCC